MRVLSGLAGWMLGAALTVGCDAATPAPGLPAIGRPEGTSQGPRAAVVVAMRGDVSVEPSELASGTSFPARPELQLLRDDRLVVGPQSFVLVALHNGHIVRLNEGSRLRVDAMAAFADPPAGTGIEQRFADALSPAERDDVELRGAITRVAGWNTRMSAAETIAPQPAQSAPPLPQDLSEPSGAATVDVADTKTNQGPPSGASKRNSKPTDDAKNGGGGGPLQRGSDKARTEEPLENTKPDPSSPPQDDTPAPKPEGDQKTPEEDKGSSKSSDTKKSSSSKALDLPDTVDHLDRADRRTHVGLPGPLRAERAELAKCAGPGAKIRAQVRGKRLVALEVNGVASKCVPGLIGKTVAQPDGWIEMTVQP